VLYRRPRDVFVAAFIGSPSMNLVEATVARDAVQVGSHVIPLDVARHPGRDGRVVLGVRPEAFEDAGFADPSLPRIDVHVDVLEQLGADTHACFRVEARRPDVDLGTDDDQAALVAEQSTLFTARVDPRSAARQGAPLRLAVDPAAFHFFDVDTGVALGLEREAPDAIEQVPVASAENWS
jgi:multiple sugar transport system ATP-binding protein